MEAYNSSEPLLFKCAKKWRGYKCTFETRCHNRLKLHVKVHKAEEAVADHKCGLCAKSEKPEKNFEVIWLRNEDLEKKQIDEDNPGKDMTLANVQESESSYSEVGGDTAELGIQIGNVTSLANSSEVQQDEGENLYIFLSKDDSGSLAQFAQGDQEGNAHLSDDKIHCPTTVNDDIEDQQCSHCEHATSNSSNLPNHIKDVRDKMKAYKCRKCQHAKKKDKKCIQCDYAVSSNSLLSEHTKTVHGENEDNKCPHCEDAASESANQSIDIKTVEKCRHCDYTTLFKSDLSDRIKEVHDDIMTHSCPHCLCVFTDISRLTIHILVVHDKRKRKSKKIMKLKKAETKSVVSSIDDDEINGETVMQALKKHVCNGDEGEEGKAPKRDPRNNNAKRALAKESDEKEDTNGCRVSEKAPKLGGNKNAKTTHANERDENKEDDLKEIASGQVVDGLDAIVFNEEIACDHVTLAQLMQLRKEVQVHEIRPKNVFNVTCTRIKGKTIYCKLCIYAGIDADTVYRHVNHEHLQFGYRCHVCRNVSPSMSEFQQHMVKAHEDQGPQGKSSSPRPTTPLKMHLTPFKRAFDDCLNQSA
jgi:hypothetical protein